MYSAGYIDRQFITGEGDDLAVENPSDGTLVAKFPGLSADQIEASILSAKRAFDGGEWSGLTVAERGNVLRRFVDALEQRSDELADIIVKEAGCPPHSAVMYVQVAAGLRMARECIELFESLPDEEENPLPDRERTTPDGRPLKSLRCYSPLGVVAGIAAYNFPLYTALWKVMPALMAGNTMVLRPNPLTPLSVLPLGEAATEAALPAGVLNIVLEAGHHGAQMLTTHPAVSMVAFTGSTAVGAQVAAQAGPSFKRLQLELGGKSAQVFLPDSPDEVIVGSAVAVCTSHAGQGCAIGTRLLVPEARKAKLVKKISEAYDKLRVGPATDPDTDVGPVISAGQVGRCEHFVGAAVKNGARIAAGGARVDAGGHGHFFAPTLLDLPDNANIAAQEEIFGPVAVIIGYRDIDHAVEMANDSKYGLSGYVFGRDQAQAEAVGRRIRSGTVHVNGALSSTYASFGGQRASGIGRERGVEGLRLYQDLSCLTLAG